MNELTNIELEAALDRVLRGDQGAAQRIIDHNKALQSKLAENAKLKAVLHSIAYTIDQHDLRSALRSGDQLKIIASVTTLFNDCRDKAQAALEATP